MRIHALVLPDTSEIPLLDDEFDRFDPAAPAASRSAAGHLVLCVDRAWDDQLDEGEEISL